MQNYSPLCRTLSNRERLRAEAGLAVRRLCECQHLRRRHHEHVGGMAVPALVGGPEAVLMRCETPYTVILSADLVRQPGQRLEPGQPLGVAFDDDVEPVVPRVDT